MPSLFLHPTLLCHNYLPPFHLLKIWSQTGDVYDCLLAPWDKIHLQPEIWALDSMLLTSVHSLNLRTKTDTDPRRKQCKCPFLPLSSTAETKCLLVRAMFSPASCCYCTLFWTYSLIHTHINWNIYNFCNIPGVLWLMFIYTSKENWRPLLLEMGEEVLKVLLTFSIFTKLAI